MGCANLREFQAVKSEVPEENYVELDGVSVYREVAGSGHGVILLHGFAASSYTFRNTIPKLADKHRVIAPDWFGFGFTERPSEPRHYQIPGQIAMIRNLMESEQIKEAHFVGHSFGAVIAYAFAKTYPEKTTSLTLLSPPPALDGASWLLTSKLGRAITYPMLLVMLSRDKMLKEQYAKGYYNPSNFTDEDAEAYLKRLRIKGIWSALNGFFSADSEDAESFSWEPVEMPSQLIGGRHDPIVPVEKLESIKNAFSPDSYIFLEASAHNAPEEEPDAFVTALTNFWEQESHEPPQKN